MVPWRAKRAASAAYTLSRSTRSQYTCSSVRNVSNERVSNFVGILDHLMVVKTNLQGEEKVVFAELELIAKWLKCLFSLWSVDRSREGLPSVNFNVLKIGLNYVEMFKLEFYILNRAACHVTSCSDKEGASATPFGQFIFIICRQGSFQLKHLNTWSPSDKPKP